MRILVATFHRNVIGGTEKYLQALLPRLIALSHEVGLVYEKPLHANRECIDIPEAPIERWCFEELGLSKTISLISQWRPDVVYSQGLESGELESALLDDFPVVLFAHGYYGTCGTGSKSHAFPQYRPCERRFGPACLLLHYPRHCGALRPAEAWRVLARQFQRHRRFSDYKAIVVGSTHMYREFQRNGATTDQLRLAPLPCADGVTATDPPGPRTPQGNILLMGRLTPAKGGHYLLPAISSASAELGKPLHLTIAGDGPERPHLTDLARKLGIAVEFVGWIDSQRKAQLLQTTDLLAMPSLWPEPFGLVGIEAGRLGIPAVGYAVGGIPDWLIPGETGELAPGDPPSVQGLSEAIVRAISDSHHYATLRLGAWSLSRRFTMDAHLAQLERVLGVDKSSLLMTADL